MCGTSSVVVVVVASVGIFTQIIGLLPMRSDYYYIIKLLLLCHGAYMNWIRLYEIATERERERANDILQQRACKRSEERSRVIVEVDNNNKVKTMTLNRNGE